jgi:GPH family glycoside/pentoside/hexuronide:cation symporter
MTVNYAHVNVVDAFLRDLAAAVERVRKPSLRKIGDRLFLGLTRGAVRLLPEKVVSRISSQISRRLGVGGHDCQPGQIGLALMLALFAGISVSVAHVLPEAIFPDVIEWDELKTRTRHEGVYYGAANFMRKLASAMARSLALLGLGLFGYQNPPEGAVQFAQPAQALQAIRMLTGPVGGIFLLASILAAWFYPITRERHARMRRLLARRKARGR